jgi:hypothetical protein
MEGAACTPPICDPPDGVDPAVRDRMLAGC